MLWQKNSVFGRVSSYLLFEFELEGVGAYSRWVLIQGWALIRMNMVCKQPDKKKKKTNLFHIYVPQKRIHQKRNEQRFPGSVDPQGDEWPTSILS